MCGEDVITIEPTIIWRHSKQRSFNPFWVLLPGKSPNPATLLKYLVDDVWTQIKYIY